MGVRAVARALAPAPGRDATDAVAQKVPRATQKYYNRKRCRTEYHRKYLATPRGKGKRKEYHAAYYQNNKAGIRARQK